MNTEKIIEMIVKNSSVHSELAIYVKDVVNEYKKKKYTNKNISNIRTVSTRFPWWKELNSDMQQIVVENVRKKLN